MATKQNDYIKYTGPHPHVAVPEVGSFVRDEPTGPFDAETIATLTTKKDEFVACSAPAPAKEQATSTQTPAASGGDPTS